MRYSKYGDKKCVFEAGDSLWAGSMLALAMFVGVGNISCSFDLLSLMSESFIDKFFMLIIFGSSFFLLPSFLFLILISNWSFWRAGFLEPLYLVFFICSASAILIDQNYQFLVFLVSLVVIFAGFYININKRFLYFAGEYDIDIVGVAVAIWVEEHRPVIVWN